LALTAGIVPESTSIAPARAGFGGTGEIWVEPAHVIPAAVVGELRRLGVEVRDSSDVALDQAVSCWPQLLPLQRAAIDGAADTAPVLFEVATEAQLTELVGEILRLGNDRPGLRWLDSNHGTRALLRVIGPPYYSLLRALDRPGDTSVVAYREASPRVWVQLGYAHALADHLRAPSGKLLLMRPPCTWTFVDE